MWIFWDAVIGSLILHNLDLERSWQKIYSLPKPGGRISFAEPNMLNAQIYAERHSGSFFLGFRPTRRLSLGDSLGNLGIPRFCLGWDHSVRLASRGDSRGAHSGRATHSRLAGIHLAIAGILRILSDSSGA
jgi:hypothetical protein